MKPMRWRRAAWPDAGTRWATPMNHHIWMEAHGDDVELWQAGRHLATVAPSGSWSLESSGKRRGKAETVADAKTQAKKAAQLEQQGVG